MSSALEDLSIIIPAAPDERAHEKLLADLAPLACEVIVSSETSRAKSLNAGAASARGRYLWFLHADSRVSAGNLEALKTALHQQGDALHYFDLVYAEGGLASLNALGANLRARLLDLPYGDQGLCLPKARFEAIGGYPENAAYGEDALFVRRARLSGVPLNRTASSLKTSARAYHEHGWLRLTVQRQRQMIQLMRQEL